MRKADRVEVSWQETGKGLLIFHVDTAEVILVDKTDDPPIIKIVCHFMVNPKTVSFAKVDHGSDRFGINDDSDRVEVVNRIWKVIQGHLTPAGT